MAPKKLDPIRVEKPDFKANRCLVCEGGTYVAKLVFTTPEEAREGRQSVFLCAPCRSRLVDAVSTYSPYESDFGDDLPCECGHPYYRHFDTYDGMAPVGCKYCECHYYKLDAQ